MEQLAVNYFFAKIYIKMQKHIICHFNHNPISMPIVELTKLCEKHAAIISPNKREYCQVQRPDRDPFRRKGCS